MNMSYWTTELEDVRQAADTETQHHLIVWNDEVNTFDWVIKALVEICHHSQEQAEQCTLLIHFKGKYAVKKGSFETLRPMCEAFLDWGINATID
jgi:ATP-dependent Clp protease adaptor protein ClpS